MWRGIIYKIACLLIVLLPMKLWALNDTTVAVDTQKEKDALFLDMVPAQGIYPCWDTTKVDPYKVNVKDSLTPTFLEFVSEDCEFTMPIMGEITSRFGWRRGRMHKGIDIDLITGDTVSCVFDGIVRISEYSPSFGNFVVVRHYNGLETLYAHFVKLKVKVGETVLSGQTVGLGGNTGNSRGSHLHFEVRFLGKSMNPETIFDFTNGVLKMKTYEVTSKDFAHVGSSYRYSTSGRRYHKIKSGETLGHIARKYRTSVRALCRLNRIRSTSIIRAGKTLRVR